MAEEENLNANNDISPQNLVDIKLRLLHNAPDSTDTISAIDDLIQLGYDATPLIPVVVELYINNKLPYLYTDKLITLCKSSDSPALLEACRQKGEHRKCSAYDKCRLLALGLTELEDDLVDYLWKNWQSSSDWQRAEVVRTLGEHGGRKSLEMLDVIRYRLAAIVQEQQAALANFTDKDWEDQEKVSNAIGWRADAGLLDDVREAASVARKRYNSTEVGESEVDKEGSEPGPSGDSQSKAMKADEVLSSQDVPSVSQLVAQGENERCEFKSTLRINLHTGKEDKKMEHSCLKTIAAFLNSHGGYLLIGVNDQGKPLGIEVDGFPNEDKMHLHLVNLLRQRIGAEHLVQIESRFETLEDKRVLVVKCRPSKLPVYLRDGNTEQFYVRTGPATTELLLSQIQGYIKQRF
jgi:SOS response regulatory protein OraA/RecX